MNEYAAGLAFLKSVAALPDIEIPQNAVTYNQFIKTT